MRFLRSLFLGLRGLVNLGLSTFRVCFVWHSFYQLLWCCAVEHVLVTKAPNFS